MYRLASRTEIRKKNFGELYPLSLNLVNFVIFISAPDSRLLFCNSPGYLSKVTGYRLDRRSLSPFRELNFSLPRSNVFSGSPILLPYYVGSFSPHKTQEPDDDLSLRLRVCGTFPVNPSYVEPTITLARSFVTSEKRRLTN